MTTGTPGTEAIGGDDHYSPAEAAFFESGGLKADGLFEAPKTEAPEKVEPAKTEGEPNGKAKPAAEAKQDVEPGEIAVEDDGRVRDAKTGRFVPLPVLQREREEHKTTKKERDELRQKWDSIIAKFDGINKATAEPAKVEAKQETKEEDIDPEKDLLGWAKQQKARADRLEQKLAESRQQTEQRISKTETQNTYERDVMRFVQEKPDFRDAYNAVVTGRARQLMLLSPEFVNADGSPNVAALQKQIREEEADIVTTALKSKRSPAEVLYNLAAVYGYAPKAKEEAKPSTEEKPAVNGKTPAEEVVERIEKGQAGAKTLSGAGGGEASGLTMEQFLAMPDEVVANRITTDPAFKRQVDAIMGKR